jgi:hypothetical protein
LYTQYFVTRSAAPALLLPIELHVGGITKLARAKYVLDEEKDCKDDA